MSDFGRRRFLTGVGGFLGFAAARHAPALDLLLPRPQASAKSVIVVWLGGGASQFETWDPKEGRATGGPTKSIETNVKGVRISEHLPRLARMMDKLSIVRSMTGKEGDHDRATYFCQTGYVPGPVLHPSLGSLVAREIGDPGAELPNFVSLAIEAERITGAGFLPAEFSPLIVRPGTPVANTAYPKGLTRERFAARLELLRRQEEDFLRGYGGEEPEAHRGSYEKADRLLHSPLLKAFDVRQEREAVLKAYDARDANFYGTACLVARRLVEAGVKFVQVAVNSAWDHHKDVFAGHGSALAQLDPALSALLRDLDDRGMLASTLVLCMGEFGRTPKINADGGRDHYPRAWSLALAGGGIQGGRVVGSTDDDGVEVKDRPVRIPDLLATIYACLGVDPRKKLVAPLGLKLEMTDKGTPVRELLS